MSEESPETVARSYESATARLDEIIRRLDSGEAQLRETLELCEEAKTLIEYCATELAAVDQGLKELKLEDLAASLTGDAAGSPVSESPAGSSERPAASEASSGPPESPSDLPSPPEPEVPF